MDTPAAEPSSYGTFDTLCGLVAGSAVIMLAVGACLLLGALVTYANADQPGTTDIAKLESKALAASLVSYGVTCFTSGIPLLIFSYGGWIFLDLARNNRLQVQKTDDLARNNRLQVQKTDEVLKHLAEINPKYEERLRREQEAAQRRAEAEQEAAQRKAEAEQEATQRKAEKERQEALARWTAEREQFDRKRLAEEQQFPACGFRPENRDCSIATGADFEDRSAGTGRIDLGPAQCLRVGRQLGERLDPKPNCVGQVQTAR